MSNKAFDTSLFDRAAKFAIDAHGGIERRGKGFPYIIHCMEAAEIVATMTNDPELLAAAMLHDVVEDTDITAEDIRKEFGDRVAELVTGESDPEFPGLSESESWIARKRFVIERLANQPRDNKIVALGDKLSNMRAIAKDYAKLGDGLWARFHVTDPRLHKWHYEGLALSLAELDDTDAYREFVGLINATFEKAVYSENKLAAAKEINLEDWYAFGDGYTAISYYHNTNPDIMMKLYEPFINLDSIAEELEMSKIVAAADIPIPSPGELVKCGNKYGCTFTRIQNKRSFARAMSQESENTEKYARQFARLCKDLHSKHADNSKLQPTSALYRRLVAKADVFDIDQKLKILDFIDSVPEATTCLHGDLHCGNALITSDGKEYFIDLADFSYGNPMYDIGTVYCAAMCFDDEHTFRLYHCHKDQMAEYWKFFAYEYFGISTEEELAEIEETVKKFAGLRAVFFAGKGGWSDELKEIVIKYMGL